MIRVFKSLEDIPEYSEKDRLWQAVSSEGIKEACIISMFSELTEDVGSLTNAQCRTKLARMQGYYNTAFFRERLDVTISNRNTTDTDEVLEDPEFIH